MILLLKLTVLIHTYTVDDLARNKYPTPRLPRFSKQIQKAHTTAHLLPVPFTPSVMIHYYNKSVVSLLIITHDPQMFQFIPN